MKNQFFRKYTLIVLIILILLFFCRLFYDNFYVVTRKVEIERSDIPKEFDNYTFLQITDLHAKSFGQKQKRLIETIQSLNYDAILLTGDYYSEYDANDIQPILDLIDGLPKEKPKFYVLGNTESFEGSYEFQPNESLPISKEFAKRNIKQIYPIIKIAKESSSIWLTGMFYDKDKLRTFLKSGFDPTKDFYVTVLHRPVDYNIDERLNYLRESNAENTNLDYKLLISGHTHGGQIRFPFIDALIHPNYGFFIPPEKYTYGLHKDSKGRVSYISSGLGASGPALLRFRFYNPPEVVLITLKKK